jgi:tetratricopeptide (TPR) repeat protein
MHYEERITSLENTLFSEDTGMIDETRTKELVDAYMAYADKWPEDTNSVNYLFKAADISMNLLDPYLSLELFERIMEEYPGYEKIPHCLFLRGYILENNLRDLDAAKELYLEFLEKYPDHDFADDVEISLKYLGKSPEELIREFQEGTEADTLEVI